MSTYKISLSGGNNRDSVHYVNYGIRLALDWVQVLIKTNFGGGRVLLWGSTRFRPIELSVKQKPTSATVQTNCIRGMQCWLMDTLVKSIVDKQMYLVARRCTNSNFLMCRCKYGFQTGYSISSSTPLRRGKSSLYGYDMPCPVARPMVTLIWKVEVFFKKCSQPVKKLPQPVKNMWYGPDTCSAVLWVLPLSMTSAP